MAKYSGQRDLPSCEVSQLLLSDIEAYILRRSGDIDGNLPKWEDYSFSITDSVGTERMGRVADHTAHLFPDDTKLVALSLSGMSFRVRVHFNADGPGYVSVELDGPNARELSRGILDGVVGLIKPFENFNRIFQPNLYGFLVLIGVVVCSVIIIDYFLWSRVLSDQGTHRLAIAFTTLLVLGLFVGAEKLRPYTTFATRLNQRRARAWGWFVGTLCTGILASLIAAFLFGRFK